MFYACTYSLALCRSLREFPLLFWYSANRICDWKNTESEYSAKYWIICKIPNIWLILCRMFFIQTFTFLVKVHAAKVNIIYWRKKKGRIFRLFVKYSVYCLLFDVLPNIQLAPNANKCCQIYSAEYLTSGLTLARMRASEALSSSSFPTLSLFLSLFLLVPVGDRVSQWQHRRPQKMRCQPEFRISLEKVARV